MRTKKAKLTEACTLTCLLNNLSSYLPFFFQAFRHPGKNVVIGLELFFDVFRSFLFCFVFLTRPQLFGKKKKKRNAEQKKTHTQGLKTGMHVFPAITILIERIVEIFVNISDLLALFTASSTSHCCSPTLMG